MNVLITGAAGFVGKNLTCALQNIKDGKDRTHPGITLDELSSHLRQKDVLDITAVQFAILETDGNLSVFPYPAEQPASARAAGIQAGKQYLPVTIIEDGFFSDENLHKAGKDRRWLDRVLEERRTTVSDTFLLTVDRAGHICWLRKEGKP